MLKKHFKVSSSKNIPTKSLEEAKRLVYNWRPSDCFILAKTNEMIEEYDKGILCEKKSRVFTEWLDMSDDGRNKIGRAHV